MRTIRMLSSALLVGAMAVMTPGGAASAATDTTYAGVFAGRIIYEGCTTTPHRATTTGDWSIALHGSTAKGTFDIYVNGVPHVAYVFPSMKQAPVDPGTTFAVSGMTGAGLLTVTLKGDDMTYRIAPYNLDGLSCDSVTYPGHLT